MSSTKRRRTVFVSRSKKQSSVLPLRSAKNIDAIPAGTHLSPRGFNLGSFDSRDNDLYMMIWTRREPTGYLWVTVGMLQPD